MRNPEQIVMLTVIISSLVSAAYCVTELALCGARKRKQETGGRETAGAFLMRTAVMLLCPVVGPLCFAASFLLDHTPFFRNIDLSDVIFHKTRVKTYALIDEESEKNLAPIEETLKIGDDKKLRSLMLNVLQGDLEDSLGSIALALNSEDSETSHYAASVLRDELNDFRMKVQKISDEIPDEPDNETGLEEMLFDSVGQILVQNVFADLEQKKYVQIFEETAEKMYEKKKETMTLDRYDRLCAQLRSNRMTGPVKKWTDRLSFQYPGDLVTYKSRLKLCYMENDKEGFFQTLSELRKADVTVDQETLEILRTFHP